MGNWALVVVDCSSGRLDLKVCPSDLVTMEFVRYLTCVCVSLFYVIDTGSIRPRARILGGPRWGLPIYPPLLLRR